MTDILPTASPQKGVIERLGWTFAAAVIAALPVSLALTSNGATIAWSTALTAGIAGLLALVKNLLIKPPAFAANPVLNVIERLLWTAVQAFVASLPATVNLTGHNLTALAYSGLMAAIAAVVSLSKNLTVTATAAASPYPNAIPASIVPVEVAEPSDAVVEAAANRAADKVQARMASEVRKAASPRSRRT